MRLHIPLVLVAVFSLLLMPYGRHHHHGDVICTVTEHCDKDDVDNDRHTHHAGSCVEKNYYIDTRQDDSYASGYHFSTVAGYVPASAVKPDFFPFIIDCSSRFIIKHRKCPVRVHKALRAPPISPDFGTRV